MAWLQLLRRGTSATASFQRVVPRTPARALSGSALSNSIYKVPCVSSASSSSFSSSNVVVATTALQKRHCSHARHLAYGKMTLEQRELLPAHVRPVHYNLTMNPDLEKYTYSGSVGIDLEVKESAKTVSVNGNELELQNVELSTGEKAAKINYDEKTQQYEFVFEKGVTAGEKVTLNIDFTGTLNDKMAGFYRSVHTDDKGTKRVVATTQMEPTDCRRAFPCFDEPALKATFDVTLIHNKLFTALSNSSVKKQTELENGVVKTEFNTTPIMSTYLVAFVVGELNFIETLAFRVPIRVYTSPGLEHKGKFSLDLAAKTLAFFEEQFGTPYPLPKMDMIAIHDFSAGAMENWGLVTYRVVDLLLDEKTDSAAHKNRVAEVVQHELAHQWFGNLVTMEWWDGLWLNEGFATWMSWYSCNNFYPEWRVWETYVSDTLQASLRMDGMRSSHPIEVPIQRADQVNEIFDAISYQKGSSVIKMIADWLGEKTFIEGIAHYLKRHAYGNTNTIDLWNALSEVSGKDVAGMMGIWTAEKGYPIVTVTEDGSKITAKQNRFLSSGDVKPEEDKVLYPVNLAVRTKDGIDNSLLLTERETTFEADPEFYKLNAQQGGIYRVKYPLERVSKLSEAGASGLLTTEDRIGLVSDFGALGVSGYQKTTALLELVSKWKNEKETNVWSQMLVQLATLRTVWMREPEAVKQAFLKLQGDLVIEKSKQLGFEIKDTDGLLEQQLKADLYAASLSAEDPEYIKHAEELFAKFIAGDKSAINANLRAAVFVAATKYAKDASIFDTMLALYKAPDSGTEGLHAIAALGRCPIVEVREKALAATLDSDTGIRSQDIFYVIRGLQSTPEGNELCFDWIVKNYDILVQKFPPATGMLGSVIEIAASGWTNAEGLDRVNKLFENRDLKGIEQSVSMAKERISQKISWLNRDRADVEQWFKAHGYLA